MNHIQDFMIVLQQLQIRKPKIGRTGMPIGMFVTRKPKCSILHKIFGACNVVKILNELPYAQREDAVNYLAYKDEARLIWLYGVYFDSPGKSTLIYLPAKQELASYMGPATQSGMMPILKHPEFMFEFSTIFRTGWTGMDAQEAYDIHHLRNEKPYLAQGPISNKGTQ